MLAGGMTIAAPSMMPQAAAAGALYVSAENAMFDNTFGGAQVIEVVVLGVSTETDEKQGEPVVKVDENQLRMAQAVDGNWYAYFGNEATIEAADAAAGYLNFGTNADPDVTLGDWAEASDVFMQVSTTPNTVVTNAPSLSNYNNTDSTNATDPEFGIGQIGIDTADWPVIQLYDLTIETFDVVYEQAGADERVTLNFDSGDLDDFASLTLDRNSASEESDIHLVITDNQLNIDPTAEDIVSFYVATDAEAVSWMNRTTTWGDTDFVPTANSFDDNGKLIINNATAGSVILANDATIDDATADNFVIFYEGGENSGIFYNTDDDDDANIDVADYAKRGFTATFDYNDTAQSFVVANDFGVITMEESSVGDVWNSGEALTVTLIDQDLNKNSASDEDLVMKNTTKFQLIPSLTIGSPLSVTTSGDDIEAVSKYSKIAYYTNASTSSTVRDGATANISIVTGYTGAQLDAIDTQNTYFNWDFTAFTNVTTSADAVAVTVDGVCLVNATDNNSLACSDDVAAVLSGSTATGTAAKGITEIRQPGSSSGSAHSGDLRVELNLSVANGAGSGTMTSIPFVADVFSFGDAGVNNAVYRILLEETDDNSATFVGTIEYTMLTQINVNDNTLYANLATIDQDVDVIVEQDMTDEDSLRVNYNDKGADGVTTQISDQVEAPTHNGVVSFDLDNYKIGDTVVVTLDDQDMNEDSELIDVYTTQATGDVVGTGTTLATGLVLDVTFDDETWVDKTEGSCSTTPTGSNGLHDSGFTLVETGAESGIFTGSFQIPTNYCSQASDTTITVTGTDIEVNYQDFRNASGESTEVGDGASVNANTGSATKFVSTLGNTTSGATDGLDFDGA
jgi:hypothetical protein